MADVNHFQESHIAKLQGGAFGAKRKAEAKRLLKTWKMHSYKHHHIFQGSHLLHPCLKYHEPHNLVSGRDAAWGGKDSANGGLGILDCPQIHTLR